MQDMLPSGHSLARPIVMGIGVIVLATTSLFAGEFTTSGGKTVEMPDVQAMSCEQMEATLAAIDATRYRENSPKPRNPEDKPLHNYETKLAQAHYETCVVQTSGALTIK